MKIRSWKAFVRAITKRRSHLLARIHEFPDALLIAGCQRSGTTIVSQILLESRGITDYRRGGDSELEGALLLSGLEQHVPHGRYVFQTTYVNRIEDEYSALTPNHRLIWMVRRPESVVYSMLHNWPRWALNHLFRDCGTHFLEGIDRRRYRRYGIWGVRPLSRACAAYSGKTSQVHALGHLIEEERLLVVDYDSLVMDPEIKLRQIFEFAGLAYRSEYPRKLHTKSLKKSSRFSQRDSDRVKERCESIYDQAKALAK